MEFGVVRIDSAIVECIHSAIIQLVNPAGQLLLPGRVRPEWIPSAYYLNSIQPLFNVSPF